MIKIVSDSSIDIFELDSSFENLKLETIPFTIEANGKEFIDDENVDVDELLENITVSKTACRTSCPSTYSWYNAFEGDDDIIALTISSNLSGSYNAAMAAKQMILEEQPNRKIEVIDSLSAGPALEFLVKMIKELQDENKTFNEIVSYVKEHVLDVKIAFALTSFDNLVKNGRMNKIAGFVAGRIGLCGLGIGSEEGTIKIKGVILGSKRLAKAIVEDIEKRASKVKEVIIHHVKNSKLANSVSDSIKEVFPKVQVLIKECRALCSFYAEKGGLILAYK